MANFNMATNGINRKRHDQEYIYQSDDFSQLSFDIKKVKMNTEESNGPSRVVHVRNVPLEIDDTVLSFLAVPFGFIDNIVFVRKNAQVLIQMREVNDALEMVDYFSQYVPLIYGKQLFVQYSKHQHLELKARIPHIDQLIYQANEKREFYLANWANNNAGASEILRILIDKATNLTINHLVFYKIFSRFGQIARIVSYTKNGQHHGLVEFLNPLAAHVAQLLLNNAYLLGDSGIMRIDFSKIPGPLQVNRPSDKVRDYIQLPLNMNEQHEMESPHYNFPLFSLSQPMLIERLEDQFQVIQPLNKFVPERRSITNFYDETSALTPGIVSTCSQLGSRNAEQGNWRYDNQARSNAYSGDMDAEATNSVVLLTNLNAEKSNPDALFTLFGVYGDVLRVKVMFNKKNTALVQYPNHQQAVTAIRNLDGCFLWGKQMHLHISKTNVIQLPMEEANHGMTKDYSNSSQHRFKQPNSKNYQNIFPPSAVLHLSNIPPTTDESDLISMFKNAGYDIKKFKYLPLDKKMAMVEFGSVEDAVHGLIEFNNYKLSEKNYLRIGFSKISSF